MEAQRKTIHVAILLIVISTIGILLSLKISILNNILIGILGSTIVSLFLLVPECNIRKKTNKNCILNTFINIEIFMKQIE